jgi:lysophospholipase L1-like esterase
MKKGTALSSAVISVIASIGLLESIPRVVEIPGLKESDLRPVAFELGRANIQAHPYLAFANKPGYKNSETAKHQISHNSLGFRGPEFDPKKSDGAYRIVCLGGSSTYGHGPSADDTTWPARLEAQLREKRPKLNIEVINAGCRGYSTFESLGNYAFRVSHLEPDHVVIYHTVNDMRCALYPGVKPDNTHWRPVWKKQAKSPFDKSYTYLIWRRYLTDHFETIGDMGNYLIVDFDKNLKQASSPPTYRRRGGETETGYNNFRRNLEAITAMAVDDGAAVTIMTQAYKPQADPETNEEILAFEEMTNIIREVCDTGEARIVDIQGELRLEELRRQSSGSPSLFIDTTDVVEVHLLDAGAELVASTLAEALLPE